MKTARTKLTRAPQRGSHDPETIRAILDEALIGHVAWVQDGRPAVIPTLIARDGDKVLIHGSSASRMLRLLAAGAPACVTVTILDGWVLARSAFETSANYDSVVLFGSFRQISSDEEKLAALEAFMDGVLPGRWHEVRPPSRQELKGTAILALTIAEASVKTRNGPPDDDDHAERETWAGVIPVRHEYGSPQPSPGLRAGVALSPSVRRLLAR